MDSEQKTPSERKTTSQTKGTDEIDNEGGGGHTPLETPNKKRRPGRPAGPTPAKTEEDLIEIEAKVRHGIKKSQKVDCKALRDVIREVRSMDKFGAGPTGSPSAAMANIVRATQTLHQLEKEANDFGGKGTAVKAIIIVPATFENMAQWQVQANKQIATAGVPQPPTTEDLSRVSIEDAIIGEPEDD